MKHRVFGKMHRSAYAVMLLTRSFIPCRDSVIPACNLGGLAQSKVNHKGLLHRQLLLKFLCPHGMQTRINIRLLVFLFMVFWRETRMRLPSDFLESRACAGWWAKRKQENEKAGHPPTSPAHACLPRFKMAGVT